MTTTTTLTVIRAEAGYNVIQAILNPVSGRGIVRILTPVAPQRVWRSGAFSPALISDNPVWKNIEQRELVVDETEVLRLSDAPRSVTDRAAKLFPRWGVKASAVARIQEQEED